MNTTDDARKKVIDREIKKPGLRGKINAMCCVCIYDPYGSGTWRQQVEACSAPSCPLFSVRPISERDKGETTIQDQNGGSMALPSSNAEGFSHG